MGWKDSVLAAVRRESKRTGSRIVRRQALIANELSRIVEETRTSGFTPEQTLSYELQGLRGDGILVFLKPGVYLLLDEPVHIEKEELPVVGVDAAIKAGLLRLGVIEATDQTVLARRRTGQDRVRALTLENYGHTCAFCDIRDSELLVASHISRWADDPEARGVLSNVICVCRFHDTLFENGYIALSDDYRVLKRSGVNGTPLLSLLSLTRQFRRPAMHPPAAIFLRKHRLRTGFDEDTE